MKVLKAGVLGFCMGVRRAVKMAEAELAKKDRRVFTMGPLIHNPQTLASLKDRGVRVLSEEDLASEDLSLEGAVVIIRAHGVSPAVEEELKNRGARIVDATCPRVKASQLAVRSLSSKGYVIFLAGEKNHGEIKGIRGYAADAENCIVVGNPAEAAEAVTAAKAAAGARKRSGVKAALVGQTTISEDEYEAVAEALRSGFPDLKVRRTICGATRDRQNALKELCGKSGGIVVAGGKDSANSRRLLAIARDRGKTAWLAESAGDLFAQAGPALRRCGVIGLSAGASTPDGVIAEIEEELSSL
jgi:4-hydroxy-3-methylbut-2-enyl diphosphate reductase